MNDEWPRAKNVELPPKGFDAPSSMIPREEEEPSDPDELSLSLRGAVGLAIEAAKVGQVDGAQQVIENFRKKYGEALVPKELDFPVPIIPVDAIPFYMEYAEGGNDAGTPLSSMDIDPTDSIILENFGTLRQWGKEWIKNLGLCAPLIHSDFEKHGSLLQAHKLDISRVKNPRLAVVCGSGSSLEDLKSLLPAFPGLVICGASNASTVVQAGRLPDAILAIDSGPATIDHLKDVPFDDLGIPLICSTIMHPEVPKLFPKNRKWFTSIIQMAKGANHPFNVFSQMLFPFINSYMFQAGCTVNAEILLLNMMEEMNTVKFDAIFLLGVDFCYKKDAPRCKAFKKVGDIFEETKNPKIDSVPTDLPIRRSFNGEVTDTIMLAYKRSLLTCWIISKLPLYDCSNGIITEVPRANFKKLAASRFEERPPLYSGQEAIDSYSAYLSRIGYVPGKNAGAEGSEIEGLLW